MSCVKGFSSVCPNGHPPPLALTFKLLRHNKSHPLEDVFRTDIKAVRFIIDHPDYLEGVRARIVDKDDDPRWQPDTVERVGDLDIDL